MNLEQIKAVLSTTVITVSEQPVTLGGLLLIPLIIYVGLLLTKWSVRLVTKRLTTKKTDPNIIHLLNVFFM